MDIILDRLCKSYGENQVLSNFSALIPRGRTTCIMAPSGRGKTTLLRILMGLEGSDSGAVSGLAGLRRSAVFQEDRLCENLSPVANIRLVCPHWEKKEIVAAMESVGLKGCASQPVRELSGGMRRRVSILRALLADYDILFLDEPFKGLDADTKALVMEDARRRSEGKTVLLVTHDPTEAEALKACQRIEV
ncbi:NitT/TauT family transport system ATP-binding protein [Desulfitobacterium chlororespirans DSM 11544]|uniref:NitT/TauT family transport system ATP-binding protein n=1 Tax=Desulfitobacterium chlororespirans DSM 11544 TaxID=1121395 RepID=A0A1M7UY52_9FIRM|nr:ATP-binding cassette domain-containing protein [Desulfitobacterium chlororespirans]SHN87875.1 NitT/TauT family transport system ATP-binding protein [Desulfitobacterium chlororespirans DSM 11544]